MLRGKVPTTGTAGLADGVVEPAGAHPRPHSCHAQHQRHRRREVEQPAPHAGILPRRSYRPALRTAVGRGAEVVAADGAPAFCAALNPLRPSEQPADRNDGEYAHHKPQGHIDRMPRSQLAHLRPQMEARAVNVGFLPRHRRVVQRRLRDVTQPRWKVIEGTRSVRPPRAETKLPTRRITTKEAIRAEPPDVVASRVAPCPHRDCCPAQHQRHSRCEVEQPPFQLEFLRRITKSTLCGVRRHASVRRGRAAARRMK